MPAKSEAPAPQKFPCHIGLDFWLKINPIKKKPLQMFYKYTDADTDIDGWTDPMLWLPIPYDLCWLKTANKTRTGWWTGKIWDGLRLRPEESVLFWKKCNEDTG